MPDIVLTTLNAKYIHASFGLRYLMANLGPLQSRARILEFDINQRATDILEIILQQNPRIVGIGVYIWNAAQSLELAADLKRIRPDIILVLGGPEISYETDQQTITGFADFVITGEADIAFAELCRKLLAGSRPLMKIIPASLPEFEIKNIADQQAQVLQVLQLPYDLYSDTDIAHRLIYVEASRGCPFKCEFCLSSLDVPVRNAPTVAFLQQMQTLLDRGVKHFKFVDRTFNLNLNISRAILDFFFERYFQGLFLHFEMIPDRLPEALRSSIERFPPGVLQFEVGIQTFNPEVSALISRRQDYDKLEDNLRFLREKTGVHIHTDLIVGLPGEDIESFGKGFNQLLAMNPHEIQVGILKRLRGTPIIRHDADWQMIYSPYSPYEILQTRLIGFSDMQRMRRFSRYWDLYANSGNFTASLQPFRQARSPFDMFLGFFDWVYEKLGRNHGIALQNLAEHLFVYLTMVLQRDKIETAKMIWQDYQKSGRTDRPEFLAKVIDLPMLPRRRTPASAAKSPRRQSRHIEKTD